MHSYRGDGREVPRRNGSIMPDTIILHNYEDSTVYFLLKFEVLVDVQKISIASKENLFVSFIYSPYPYCNYQNLEKKIPVCYVPWVWLFKACGITQKIFSYKLFPHWS